MNYGIEEPLFLILIIFLVLAWVSCLLRAWVKLVMLKKVTTDDYLMLGGILCYSGYTAAGLYGVVGGVGYMSRGMTAQNASVGLHAWWLCEVLYCPVTLFSRTSVAVFLLCIAVERLHRRIILAVLAAFWVVTIPLFITLVFQCRPISYFWKQPLPGTVRGICLEGQVTFLVSVVHSAVSALCDWTLGALPILMLWKVRLNKRTKFTLFLLLSMGIFAGIALIVRIIYVRPVNVGVNFLYRTITVADWSVLEPGICIIAGCLATLRPLFSRWGWTSARKGGCRRRLRFQHDHGSHGIRYVVGPGYMSGGGGYMTDNGASSSNSQRKSNLFSARRVIDDDALHEDDLELMPGGFSTYGKRRGMVMDEEYGRKHQMHRDTEDDTSSQENGSSVDVGESGNGDGTFQADTTGENRPTAAGHYRTRRASLESEFSMRFTSVVSLPSLQLSQQHQQNQQHQQTRWPQWHHYPARNQGGLQDPSRSTPSLSPSAPNMVQSPSPFVPAMPLAPMLSACTKSSGYTSAGPTGSATRLPAAPPPCRILVHTTTRVEYDEAAVVAVTPAPASALTLPTILTAGASGMTMNAMAGDELPKSMTFHGDHSVQISGPSKV